MTEPNAPDGWSRTSLVGVAVGVVCLAPTGAAVLASVLYVLANIVGYILGFVTTDSDFGGFTTLAVLFWSSLAGVVAAPLIAVAGLLLHPIGGVAAAVGAWSGARKSGVVLVLAHIVTFAAAATVLVMYGGLGGALLAR